MRDRLTRLLLAKTPLLLRRICYIVLTLLLAACPIYAQRTYEAEPGKMPLLDGCVAHYEDTTAQLSIRRIDTLQLRFKPMHTSSLNRGYTASHHWLHIRLTARTSQTVFIGMDNPRINDFRFYQLTQKRIVNQVLTGDALPFPSRNTPDYNWAFPVALDGKTPTDVFIMVAKRYEVLGVRVRVWDARTFERNVRDRYFLWGILTGFTLLILLINVVAFMATRETVYFWFISLIVAIAFHISAQSGLGFQYLWPGAPAFNRLDPQLLSGWLIMLTQLQFMQHFIRQRAGHSRAYGAVQTFKYVLLALLVVNSVVRVLDVFPQQHFLWTFNATLVFIVISILLAFWSIFERIHQREKVVFFYTFTLSVQLVGYLVVFFINVAFTQGREPLFQIDSYVVIVINLLFDLLILSSGILFFWFQTYRRQNEQLLTTLHEQQQAQSGRVIEALEIERNRIAEDLYDDVGAILSTAIGYVSSVLRKPGVRGQFPLLAEARQLLDQAVENLRTVSHNLMPKNFAELGLAKSVAETVDKVQASTGIAFQYVVAGHERRLDVGVEVQIFRIAVELINDIVKNARATSITIQLLYGPESLQLMSEVDSPSSLRYTNLHAKVAFVNGKIDTDVGFDGATVLIEIPY